MKGPIAQRLLSNTSPFWKPHSQNAQFHGVSKLVSYGNRRVITEPTVTTVLNQKMAVHSPE